MFVLMLRRSDSVRVPIDIPPSNKPLKLPTPPQGHWCNINGPARRRARSLTAKR